MPPTADSSDRAPVALWLAVALLGTATVCLGIASCALVRPGHDLSWTFLAIGAVVGVAGTALSVSHRMFDDVS